VEVANGEDEIFPVWIVNLFQELLVNQSSEGFVKTCLETLWRFVGDLDDFLQQT